MASKRKLEFEDIVSVTEASDSASVHGVVTYLSPVKKSKKGSNYFNATVSDGKTTCRLVGFKDSQQKKLKEAMEKKETIIFEDCQVKKAKRGLDAMEILLKRTTSIAPSPKKFEVECSNDDDKLVLVEEVERKKEFETVSLNAKVVKVMDAITVNMGKKVQYVTLADSTSTVRCSLWEKDVGTLKEGKSYVFRALIVKEFDSKVYVSKGRDSSICEIDDIVDNVEFQEPEIESTHIKLARIVAVQELNKYRCCLSCKARVEPVMEGLGRCSKEDCQMLQKYDVCPEQVQAKLMFVSESKFISLYVYGKLLLDLAGRKDTDISEEILLQLPVFHSIEYNSQDVIIKFLPESTAV